MKTGVIKVAGVLLAAGALTLTACSDSDEATVAETTSATTAAATTTSAAPSANLDDDGIALDTGDGRSVSIGGNAELPSDFPSSLPVPNGTLQTAMSAGDSWTLIYSDVDSDEIDSVTDELEAQFPDSYSTGSSFMYESDEWAITLTVDGSAVTYLVVQE